MNRIAVICATIGLALSGLSAPANAATGTGGLTCTTPNVTQAYIDGHGPYTRVTGSCSDGPAGTTWRMKVKFEKLGNTYTKTYGWADYGTYGIVTSDRLLDQVVSVVYQWGDLVVPTKTQASQDWPSPPSSIVLSHVEGSMSTGWYVAGTRYGVPVFTTFPRIGVIRNVTCATDETGACEAAWLRFYRELALFRDSELVTAGKGAVRHLPERNA